METWQQRVGRLAGSRPVAWEQRAAAWQTVGGVPGGNERFSVLLADGSRVFVKYATSAAMAGWLRREGQVYEHLRGRSCPGWSRSTTASPAARARGSDRRGVAAALDRPRSRRGRRAPWQTCAAPRLRPTRRRFAGTRPGSASGGSESPPTQGRSSHLASSRPTGCAARFPHSSPRRTRHASRATSWCIWMCAATISAFAAGRRSWSIGTTPASATATSTWRSGCRAWPPRAGRSPDEILPGAGALTAVVSGYFAAVAGLPPPAHAPTVRPLQLAQLVPALAWARRELSL